MCAYKIKLGKKTHLRFKFNVPNDSVVVKRKHKTTHNIYFSFSRTFKAFMHIYIENTEEKKRPYYKEKKKILQTNSKFSVTCLWPRI